MLLRRPRASRCGGLLLTRPAVCVNSPITPPAAQCCVCAGAAERGPWRSPGWARQVRERCRSSQQASAGSHHQCGSCLCSCGSASCQTTAADAGSGCSAGHGSRQWRWAQWRSGCSRHQGRGGPACRGRQAGGRCSRYKQAWRTCGRRQGSTTPPPQHSAGQVGGQKLPIYYFTLSPGLQCAGQG